MDQTRSTAKLITPDGEWTEPPPGTVKAVPLWRYGDRVVAVHTKGEARAALKRSLRLDRLPVGAVITREVRE